MAGWVRVPCCRSRLDGYECLAVDHSWQMLGPGCEPRQLILGPQLSCNYATACSFHIVFELYVFFSLIWGNTYEVANVCLRVVAQKPIVTLLFWCGTVRERFKGNYVKTSHMSNVRNHTLRTYLGLLMPRCGVHWASLSTREDASMCEKPQRSSRWRVDRPVSVRAQVFVAIHINKQLPFDDTSVKF